MSSRVLLSVVAAAVIGCARAPAPPPAPAGAGAPGAGPAHRWKFAPFFNAVKTQVRAQWRGTQLLRAMDPDGTRFGDGTRVTFLAVTVAPDGRLVDASVVQSCGIRELDEETTRAFRVAQPFPPPPAQLVDATRVTKFRFGFAVDPRQPGREDDVAPIGPP